MNFLKGKKILISGMLNKFSISYGIAKKMYKYGAELAFTYQNDKFKKKVLKLAKKFNSKIIIPCDVRLDKNIYKLFKKLSIYWKKFDGLVHSIAFAPSLQLKGDYLDCITKESFKITHDITSYSFVAMIKACKHMLNINSSILTISFIGSKKFIPNYNIMGLAKASLEANVRYIAQSVGKNNIRVNAISSGPIKTISSLSIKNFKNFLNFYKNNNILRKKITIYDIGNVASFLCSNLSSGITGQIIFVDGGWNII